MDLANALWLLGFPIEAALIVLLLYRRAWRAFPAFFTLVFWDFLTGSSNFIIVKYIGGLNGTPYMNAYLFEVSVSSVLEFSVLVELAWSVLKPIRGSLSRIALVYIAALILLAGAVVWTFSGVSTSVSHREALLVHLVQTVGFLRVGFFLLLAAASQWLSIGWRDRELQIATGLGFYSLVSLVTAMLRTHASDTSQFGHLNEVVIGGYLCSLLYWAVSFAQKEAARREFTPQMQSMLLAVAGAARANRTAMAHSQRGHKNS